MRTHKFLVAVPYHGECCMSPHVVVFYVDAVNEDKACKQAADAVRRRQLDTNAADCVAVNDLGEIGTIDDYDANTRNLLDDCEEDE